MNSITFLSLFQSATPLMPLDFSQSSIGSPPVTPLLDERIFSYLTIAFVYFPMKLTFEIFLLQVSEPGLSKTPAAKGIAQYLNAFNSLFHTKYLGHNHT